MSCKIKRLSHIYPLAIDYIYIGTYFAASDNKVIKLRNGKPKFFSETIIRKAREAFIMKKQFKTGIIFCIISMALMFILAGQASATPALQLYLPGAEYLGDTTIAGVSVTESWFTFANPFELVVAGARKNENDAEVIEDVTLWIAVQGDDPYANQDSKITVREDPNHPMGLDIIEPYIAGVGQPDAVTQPHGVYNEYTRYWGYHLPNLEIAKAEPDLVYNYDEYYTPENPGDSKKGDLQYYTIEYEGFFWVHMDLTGTKDGKETFAPFSHDADAPTPIPEPGTLLLLGFGLIGIAGFSRKKFKK